MPSGHRFYTFAQIAGKARLQNVISIKSLANRHIYGRAVSTAPIALKRDQKRARRCSRPWERFPLPGSSANRGFFLAANASWQSPAGV